MLNITYRDRKTKIKCWVREKTMSHTRLDKSEDGSGHRQGTSAGYEITDGHCYHHLETLRRETIYDLEEDRRDDGETN